MARKTLPNEGSPFFQEIWGDSFGLGSSADGIHVTIRDEISPWSVGLDADSAKLLGKLLQLPQGERQRLANRLFEGANNRQTTLSAASRASWWPWLQRIFQFARKVVA